MRNVLILIIAIALLSSCSNSISDSFIPKEANAFSKDFVDKLMTGDTSYCFSQIAKEFQTQQAMDILRSTFENLQFKKITNSRIISSNSIKMIGQNNANYLLEYEYTYDNNLWVYFSFRISEQEKKLKVIGFNIQPANQSLEKLNAFTFKDKSFTHYFILFLSILIVAFMIVTLIFAAKMKMKRKWLWIIFILVGFFKLQLNWTTGQLGFQFFTLNLLGVGFVKAGLVGAWIVSIGLPIGSIYFWIKRGDILFENEMDEKLEKLSKE